MLVVHAGKKDLPNGMNTINKVKKVVQSIREIDVNQEIQIVFSIWLIEKIIALQKNRGK